jgi:hypothetical protein
VKLEEILIRGGFNFRSSADYFKTNKWVWLKDGQLWTFKMGSQSIRGYVFDHDAAVKCGVISEKGDEDDAVTGIVTSQKPLNGSPVQFGDDELSFCGAVTK